MTSKTHTKHSVKQGRPPKGKRNKPTKKFLLVMPDSQRSSLEELSLWYRTALKTQVPIGFLVRTAIDEFVAREKIKVRKAEAGRYHTKVR